MPDVRQMFSGAGGPAPGQRQVVYAEVSRHQPAPVGYDDPLFVVIPDYDPHVTYQCVTWPKSQGRSLPQHGAACLLIFDDRHQPWCVAWVGHWTEWDIGAD